MTMPYSAKFDKLAAYNMRVAQGIVHTPEYQDKMRLLQIEFDEWQLAKAKRRGDIIIGEHDDDR